MLVRRVLVSALVVVTSCTDDLVQSHQRVHSLEQITNFELIDMSLDGFHLLPKFRVGVHLLLGLDQGCIKVHRRLSLTGSGTCHSCVHATTSTLSNHLSNLIGLSTLVFHLDILWSLTWICASLEDILHINVFVATHR